MDDTTLFMIRQAKVHHSDMVAAGGAECPEARAALGIVRALQGVPVYPIEATIRGALDDFVKVITTMPEGMRVGGDNKPDRMIAVYETFCDERNLPASALGLEAWHYFTLRGTANV